MVKQGLQTNIPIILENPEIIKVPESNGNYHFVIEGTVAETNECEEMIPIKFIPDPTYEIRGLGNFDFTPPFAEKITAAGKEAFNKTRTTKRTRDGKFGQRTANK